MNVEAAAVKQTTRYSRHSRHALCPSRPASLALLTGRIALSHLLSWPAATLCLTRSPDRPHRSISLATLRGRIALSHHHGRPLSSVRYPLPPSAQANHTVQNGRSTARYNARGNQHQGFISSAICGRNRKRSMTKQNQTPANCLKTPCPLQFSPECLRMPVIHEQLSSSTSAAHKGRDGVIRNGIALFYQRPGR